MDNNINKPNLSFPVIFQKVDEVENSDGRFTKVKCWLMHTEENLNKSYFSQNVIENAIPTLQYIPLVGFIEENSQGEEDFSNHRYVITKDDKGVRRKYCGSAYGVVLSNEDNNAHFEERLCDDGVTRNFLVADGIMWNFLEDSSNIVNRDMIKNHSIELDEDSIEGHMDDKGIFHFDKFSFRAACILGGNYDPAMTGSTIEVQFTMNDFVKNIQSELNDKYNSFTKIVNDINFTKVVNEKNNDGGIENMSKTNFTQTLLEQFSDISKIVKSQETFKDRWGDEIPRYYAVDVQENEVIVVDRSQGYNYFGLPFTMNGDKAEIDFACGKRKKLRYENYEEGSTTPEDSFDFGKHISEIEETAFAKVEEANAKVEEAEGKVAEFETKVTELEGAKKTAETNYTQIKINYDEMKSKYDEFVKTEQARADAELEAQKNAEFAKYETVLADNVEFEALKEKKADMTVKEIEGECAVLFARKSLGQANFTKSDKGMTAGIINNDNEDDGFVVTKYGAIPVRH